MNLEERLVILKDYVDAGIEYADQSIPLRRPKGPWDKETEKLIKEYNAIYNMQQRILNNYARAKYLVEIGHKRGKNILKRAESTLWRAQLLGILPGKKQSWDNEALEAMNSFKAKTDAEMALIRTQNHIRYELTKEQSPIEIPELLATNETFNFKLKTGIEIFNNYQKTKFVTQKIAKPVIKNSQKVSYFLVNDVILGYFTQGALTEALAKKMEKHITHISRKRTELVNTVLSNVDHIFTILGTKEISDAVAETTDNMYATGAAESAEYGAIAFAVGCVAWSVYRAGRNINSRIGKNKEKEYEVLPSIGYVSAVMHSKHAIITAKENKHTISAIEKVGKVLKKGQNSITELVEDYHQGFKMTDFKAKSQGTKDFWSGPSTVFKDIKKAYSNKSTSQR